MTVRVVAAISDLPSVPAIYALYGGEDRRYVAYVGIGDDLRRRVTQHLVNRNSSATTDTGAVRLHPDHISAVSWWEHPGFADRVELAAAELSTFAGVVKRLAELERRIERLENDGA